MPTPSLPCDPRSRRWPVAACAAVLDLVLPADCAACGGRAGPLCRACAACLPRGGALVRRAGALPGLPDVVAAGPYEGVLRAVLLAHKDGSTGLVGALSPVLSSAVLSAVLPGAVPVGAVPGGAVRPGAGRPPVLLVPAPSSARAVRERGHDHAARLAGGAARDLRRRGVPARALVVLRQARAVDDQGSLPGTARAANLHGAVVVRRRARGPLAAAQRAGAVVVLVDDVCASGATLAECGRALALAGHRPALAAVAAATVLRSWRPEPAQGEPAQGEPARSHAPGVARSPLSAVPLPRRARWD